MKRPYLDYATPTSPRRPKVPRATMLAAVAIAVAVVVYVLFKGIGL